MILDEPTAGQDYFHYKQFMSCIQQLAAQGISFIFITHDMNLALEYADRAVVLHNGEILADDNVAVVLANHSVLQQANLQESSLTTLARLSNILFPQVFVQMYMEAKRRGTMSKLGLLYIENDTYFHRMDGTMKLLLFMV